MYFSDVIGQRAVKEKLISTVTENRVSHAQLFLGPEGSGNLPLAIAYAQYISCEDKQPKDSCGICHSCLLFSKLAHPDLHFIYPINKTKEVQKPTSGKFINQWREMVLTSPYFSLGQWYNTLGIENKQGIINNDDCNDIIKKLSLKSFESEYKIMIIWMPEQLYHSVAPKLLKILEEPPEKTLFLLVAENQEKIIKTILSRTQIVKLGWIDPKDLKKAIISKHNTSEKKADFLVDYSDGSYIETIRLLVSNETREYNSREFKNWMRLCFKTDWIQTTDWIETIVKLGRERQKSFLKYCLEMIRQCLLIGYGINELKRVEGEDKVFFTKFSPFVSGHNCIQLTNALNKAHQNIERNANPRLLFMDLSIKLASHLKNKYVA